jgi:predicted metal-dependent hydrolase
LTFDLELLRQPATFRREVIIHELLHLKVPNHGQLFRSLLRAHLADGSSPQRSVKVLESEPRPHEDRA